MIQLANIPLHYVLRGHLVAAHQLVQWVIGVAGTIRIENISAE